MKLPSLHLSSLRSSYLKAGLKPGQLVEQLFYRIEAADPRIWIHRLSQDQLAAHAEVLKDRDPADLPLYGIPFAIKDNIDLAGAPTTAACPEFSYIPKASAFVVQRLIDAGAIPVGKTNLDQFATGLVGVRSPHGVPGNAFDPKFVPGGSSSGSAVAVASGLVSFALGTDTAGSGRVPAAFNNIVGLKPTPGLLSTSGVVPACRSLDCVSIFALTAKDAASVMEVAEGFDVLDPFSRKREPDQTRRRSGLHCAIPGADQLEFFGNKEYESLWREGVERLRESNVEILEVDYEPFLSTAKLLYEGPWVSERYVAVGEFLHTHPDAFHPVTREIIAGGAAPLATDLFKAKYRLAELRRKTESIWSQFDFALTPTTGTIYTIAQVEADPVRTNSNLGYYTNFMNLLGLSAVSAPAGFQSGGLPFGVTFFGPGFRERQLLAIADMFHRDQALNLGSTGTLVSDGPTFQADSDGGLIQLAVCGAHLRGCPLHHQLEDLDAEFVAATTTSPCYRFYALPTTPPKPGLIRDEGGEGKAIDIEIYTLTPAAFGQFVANIPAPLGIGKVDTNDWGQVSGFLCEPFAVGSAPEITDLGSWRAYMATMDD